MSTFGILVGGGPAPGINGVIGAAAKDALHHGHRVIGIYDGFQWLMQGDTSHVAEADPDIVETIHLRGGSILHTSRANPQKKEEHLENVVKSLGELGIDYLITIGGDDTASSANRVAEKAAGRIGVVHVPKTIDNDLPLPKEIPTFGFVTAREHGVDVVERLLLDTQTTNRWFFVEMMGRTAGHLAVGVGKAAGAPVTVIPEEFSQPIRLEDVVRVIEGAIVKRLARGRPDGVAVIAEGIASAMDPDDPLLKDVPRDEHGHIRLAEVPLADVLRRQVTESLASRGIKVTIGKKDVGYELRCGYPCAYDRDYTLDLGVGAVETLLSGKSGVLISRQEGRIVPIPFEDIIDPKTNKSRVRTVDVDSDTYKSALELQERVTREDLNDEAKLTRLAAAAKLSPEETRRRYEPR